MSSSGNNTGNLFEEFPPVSLDEWESVIKSDLNGNDYKEKLTWKTGEGVEVLPFYRRENSSSRRSRPVPSHASNDWTICNIITAGNVAEANKEAGNALDRGARGLQFKLHVKSTSGMLGGDLEGTSIQSQSDFAELFKGMQYKPGEVYFDAGLASPVLLAMLINSYRYEKKFPGEAVIFSYDPFTYMATKGQWPKPQEKLKGEIRQIVKVSAPFQNLFPLCADTRTWHNSGATIVQELALGLAAASEYLSILNETDTDSSTSAKCIHFNCSVGSKYFLEIAKFRALRLLWKQLLDAYRTDNSLPLYIHAETSRWNKTIYDPHVNMIRSTTESMSAIISGADSLTVHPFDSVFREPDEFSNRIARNTQIILREESFFNKVADPAAGSFYIEQLTDKLAELAWSLFQDIEQEGGLMASIENGTIHSLLKVTRQARDRAIATSERVFVGTNTFTNAKEQVSDNIDSNYKTVSLEESENKVKIDTNRLIDSLAKALQDGAKMGDLIPKLFELDWSKHFIRTINTYRGPAAFEELRLATEKHKKIPSVMTVPIGDKRKRKARSKFAGNFFGCVGYEITDPIGFEDAGSALQSIRDRQPDIIVLCSSDDEYPQIIPSIAEGIEDMDDPPLLVVVGNPGAFDPNGNEGIDQFIHTGCNVLETLKRFQRKMGII